jgi:predicted regulator of Ras-like GTPase activity (Roadblock/LC7/MglB family)
LAGESIQSALPLGHVARLASGVNVRLALAAGERDGLVVHAAGRDAAAADAAAALFASLYRRARAGAAAHGHGAPRLLRLQSQDGEVLAAGNGELVFVVVAERAANVGRLRLDLLTAVGAGT